MNLGQPPEAVHVRAQLERILSTGPLTNAGRLSRLLRYVVERTLAGEGAQLKEYVLGVEVFDRPTEYDPRIDSIVRVEARRLRSKLDEYYRGVGANDPVIIAVPRGSYVPSFGWPIDATATPEMSAPAAAPPDSPCLGGDSPRHRGTVPLNSPPHGRERSGRRYLGVGLLTVAAILAVAVSWRSIAGAPFAPEASTTPRVAVLPFVHFSSDPAVAMMAARVTDGVTSELARIPQLSVVSRTSAAQFTSEQRPVREVAAALDADLIVEGSLVVEDGRVRAVARLVDPVRDRKVWVGEYESGPGEIVDLQRRLAAEAGAAALETVKR